MTEKEKFVIENIQLLLKNQNKKRKDLCDFLGVAPTNFGNWTSGRNTSYMKYLYQIADFFGVSVAYLQGLENLERQNKEKENAPGGLTEGEELLLDLFRRVPEEKQELILQLIKVALNNL